MTARPTHDLNDLLVSRESLQTLSFNIWQKRHKVKNPHKIVLDFGLSNSGLIFANNSFESISISNENDQKNSPFGIIYNSNNQCVENKTNLECKPVIMGPQGVKRLRLTLEEKETRKQAKLAKRKTAKLEVVEKRGLGKEKKKVEALAKKAHDKEAKKIKVVINIEERAKRNIENIVKKK